jgi:hypothetical protein
MPKNAKNAEGAHDYRTRLLQKGITGNPRNQPLN